MKKPDFFNVNTNSHKLKLIKKFGVVMVKNECGRLITGLKIELSQE